MSVKRRKGAGDDILGAIDVGTNAVRLELARVQSDGALETLHQERDPVRPGEGLFTTGIIAPDVANRLIATLRRYAALCKRYGARVRAVATAAVREARNREELVRRVRKEAGVALEVVSGREEARLICLGVLHGKPEHQRSLCVDIGGGSTEVIFAHGEVPKDLWSVGLGAVRMSELFEAKDEVPKKQLRLMRDFAQEVIEESIPKAPRGLPKGTLGSSGTIGAIVAFARNESLGHATQKQISKAVEELADMSGERRRKRFDPRRADIVVAGAVILEAIMEHFDQETITPVDRGLREGVLQDLVRRRKHDAADRSLADAAVEVGRRFDFGEEHGKQVTRLALALFDDLAGLHQLPAAARPWLEVAALLHDIGQAVNYQRHHKHSQYLIQNADIAGLTDRERQIVGAMARFHRRSAPDAGHEAMQPFNATEIRVIRKCATLLRVADSLDRGHHQPVKKVDALVRGNTVHLRVKAASSIDLELWDVEHEAGLFREVFGKTLTVQRVR